MADRPLTLMAVHAHPDDEATGTGVSWLVMRRRASARCSSRVPTVAAVMVRKVPSRATPGMIRLPLP